MASTRRKSAAVALAFIGIAGLSLASAAQLNVNSASLGAGSSVVASCDTDGIGVSYTNTYSTTGYNVTGVTLTGINAACAGLNYKVQLTTTGGAVLGTEATGTLSNPAATTQAITVGAQAASAVTGVSVVVFG
jgi:hypothetical protein